MASWSKKDYYQGSESESEEEIAIEKLKERENILKEDDFFPDLGQEELNYNDLTEDELLEVIERDSPELMGILESVKNLVITSKNAKKAQDIVGIKYCQLLAMHISYYILLKAKGKVAANHPVVTSIKNIEKIIISRGKQREDDIDIEENIQENNDDGIEEIHNEGGKKREIDEKIKKNKGIVKKRKKIERNVRVKNKMKYMKKLKIRRSTLGIKDPRNQDHYEGETTGIRKNLIKSVKLT
ncbi:hypothetical protein SteCoe_16109 [Stentor coeruleus]|uniref:Sas10 C-terminal domain-containing protein n=1 Tax=Stentor coeruleus TaxID=5963 RepID=A0A1R2C218_9CILI|nr:hypothetical protein SteCoe_16109 [Stentor coeruleus]